MKKEPINDGFHYIDFSLMGGNVRKKLKKVGKDVIIYPMAKIANPEKVEIGDHSIISDFSLIDGGNGVKIGRFVHVASYSSIIGGGKIEIGDFAGCAPGCRLITGSDDYSGRSLTNPSIPSDLKPYMLRGKIIMGKHSILGTNTVVNPNIVIGEGSATISSSYVTKDLEPWTIYGGSPARKIMDRRKDMLSDVEEVLRRLG